MSNDCGTNDQGLGKLVRNNQVARMIGSFMGENKVVQRQYLEGLIELELIPQGTLAEKIRAGGAGIPAFFTPTGSDTIVEKGGYPIRRDGRHGGD